MHLGFEDLAQLSHNHRNNTCLQEKIWLSGNHIFETKQQRNNRYYYYYRLQ